MKLKRIYNLIVFCESETVFSQNKKGYYMDIALFSTRIFTGNPDQPWAEALKITDDRITHVGGNAEIK
jgi:hypothetical protein